MVAVKNMPNIVFLKMKMLQIKMYFDIDTSFDVLSSMKRLMGINKYIKKTKGKTKKNVNLFKVKRKALKTMFLVKNGKI